MRGKISYRVMKTDDWSNIPGEPSVRYRASCDCTDKRCDMDLELSIDEDFPQLQLIIEKDLVWNDYYGFDMWLYRMWRRIKASLRVLFVGKIEVSETFIFGDKDHIGEFIEALEQGIDMIDRKIKESDENG